MVLERRTYDPGYPAIRASADPAVIARGRYLVHGPAHCTSCHGDPRHKADFLAGRDGPLSGGVEFHLPIGGAPRGTRRFHSSDRQAHERALLRRVSAGGREDQDVQLLLVRTTVLAQLGVLGNLEGAVKKAG